jgi:uncharacterized protein (DUF1499 family)
MARRLYIDEPISLLATWSARLGLFALVVAGLSILVLRSGLLEVGPALATFAAALGCAALAILLAFGAFISIWRQGLTGLGRALRGLLLGVALLAYPAYVGSKAIKLPAISDITTDTDNPPRFVALAPKRPKDRIAYPGAKAAELQHKAYPDIVPLQVDLSARTVYELALKVVVKHRWTIADSRPPVGVRGTGVIEATARTLLMGFRDDIVIRVSPLGAGADAGSRVDLRSASRVGSTDFGANAKRLRGLLEELDDATANAPEQPPEPEPAKKPAPKRKPKR